MATICTHPTASSVTAPTGRQDGSDAVGKDVVYKQVLTDPGMFAIIYGGASAAMQSFHRRGMKQDEMLRIIAYVRTLDK
jgi:cytochrome c-L